MKEPKCNFVTTHTARRSAATNLAIQGVPLDFIAKVGGWKKLETLKKYLLAFGLDVFWVMVEYDFLGEFGLKLKKYSFAKGTFGRVFTYT